MVSEGNKTVKEISRSFSAPRSSLPPPPPPKSILTSLPLIQVQKVKNETKILDCNIQRPCLTYKCIEKKVFKHFDHRASFFYSFIFSENLTWAKQLNQLRSTVNMFKCGVRGVKSAVS